MRDIGKTTHPRKDLGLEHMKSHKVRFGKTGMHTSPVRISKWPKGTFRRAQHQTLRREEKKKGKAKAQ